MRHWHARIGVLGALFFLMLSVTGIALNHTDSLGLDKREINQTWLMRWYGLHADTPKKGFLSNAAYVVANDNQWVLNDVVLDVRDGQPVGYVTWVSMSAIASEKALYLYSGDGRLVEKISQSALPSTPILKLGILNDQLVLKTAQGAFSTKDAINWLPLSANKVVWSKSQTLPTHITKAIKELFSPALPLERIVLDVHSGRVFGRYGPAFMDGIAILLAILSLTGLWMYIRSVRAQAKKAKS